jgi:hypothetical protein
MGRDNQLRAAGYSERYVEEDRKLRALRDKYRNARIGLWCAWIGGILSLILFPPIGIFLTGFAVIMSFREGRKLREEMTETANRMGELKRDMPEK